MLGTLLVALLLILASVVIGRTLMLALGWKRPEWVAGAVGFAALVVVAPFLVRLPGRGMTAAVILAVVTVACAVVTRRAVPRRAHGETPAAGSERPRAQHLVALCVVPVMIAAACLPFLFNEGTGVLGEGIYTNDQAAQLYWADWLADGFGPQPNAVSVGYPVGPQALAASLSEGTGVNLVDAFNGLLVAIPALTALAALSLLGGLAPWRRGLAACLAGLPYLGASFLAQSGFKETVMAMLVVALAVVLHLALRREGEDREAPPARAVIGVARRPGRCVRLHLFGSRRRLVRRGRPGLGDPHGRLRDANGQPGPDPGRSHRAPLPADRGRHRAPRCSRRWRWAPPATSSTRSTRSRGRAGACRRRSSRARRSASGRRATSGSSAARSRARSWPPGSRRSARSAPSSRSSGVASGRSCRCLPPRPSSTPSPDPSPRSTSRRRRCACWRRSQCS